MKQIMITATAIAVSVMPTAFAQTETIENGVPYTITFDGERYPASLGTIEYPYAAGRLGLSGDCLLNVHVDPHDEIAAITISACSDEWFRNASQKFIDGQSFVGGTHLDLKTYPLRIDWSMEAPKTAIVIAAN